MKKYFLLFVALMTMGIQQALAQIDADLKFLVTTSDDIALTELSNDAAYPWTVTDSTVTSTHGKTAQYTFSGITLKVQAKGRVVLCYDFTSGIYDNDKNRVYLDGVLVDENTYTGVLKYNYFDLEEGEHTIKIGYYHAYYTSSSYTQAMTLTGISLKSVESQYTDIHLAAAGTLGIEALSKVSTLPAMQYLRLSGKMNADDWNTINNMTGLKAIDLSGADITEIPASAFANTALRYVTFPPTLKTIADKAFYDRYLISTLTLPDGCDSIGSQAFYRNNITSLVLPSSMRSIGTSAFNENNYLKTADLGGSIETIPGSCFYDCDSLKTVTGCGNVTTVGSEAFRDCYVLQKVEGLAPVTINGAAFYNCYALQSMDFSKTEYINGYDNFEKCKALTEVILPEIISMSSNSSGTFSSCTSLKKVVIGDKISSIPNSAFYECTALEEVTIGASVSSLGSYCFDVNSGSTYALKRVYVNAPAPPSASGNRPFYSTSGITLYVPEYATMSYKLHDYWSKFTSVDVNPNVVKSITLRSKLELSSNSRIPNSPDLTLDLSYNSSNTTGNTKLIVNGDNPQVLGIYEQDIYGVSSGKWSSVLLSRCNAMTSASSIITYWMRPGYWYYVCMPFDVKRSDISTGDGIAVRYYDSASRAENGSGGNWKDVADDATLKEGQGYIFRVNGSYYSYGISMTATEDTHNDIFRSTAAVQPLEEYASTVSNDAGWNLVGNPYPCFYDIYYMDYTAPITLWDTDKSTYTAYSVADDELALAPLQAFFVQKPTGVDQITFQPDGRQITNTIDHSTLTKQRTATQRHLIDLTLSGENTAADRTRVVVNATASDAFCADNDASKMLAYEGTPQIYTLAEGDIYAINEGAHLSGKVQIGMYFPADGTYTLDIERSDLNARLCDHGVEVAMPYTFTAGQGTDEGRFTLLFDTPTGIHNVTDGHDATGDQSIYTLSGVRVKDTSTKGVYIQNHKKIVKQ